MATEESPRSTHATVPDTSRITPEHLSIIPVAIALYAIVGNEPWTWPAATVCLCAAYLLVFLNARHLRQTD